MSQKQTKLAYNKSLDFLSRREYSAYELSKKLQLKGFSQEDTEEAIVRLQKNSLQSDTRFVADFIRSRLNKGQGEIRIKMSLREHDIKESIIGDALLELEINWTDLAKIVWDKKFGVKAGTLQDKAKQVRFLQYRGFAMDDIKSIID